MWQFVNGREMIPVRCQPYLPETNGSHPHLAFRPEHLIRIGCPKNYKVFGEFHCISVEHLKLYREGVFNFLKSN